MITLALVNKNNIVDNVVIANTLNDFESHPDYKNHKHIDVTNLVFPEAPTVGWSYDGSKFIAPVIEQIKAQSAIDHDNLIAEYQAAIAKTGGNN